MTVLRGLSNNDPRDDPERGHNCADPVTTREHLLLPIVPPAALALAALRHAPAALPLARLLPGPAGLAETRLLPALAGRPLALALPPRAPCSRCRSPRKSKGPCRSGRDSSCIRHRRAPFCAMIQLVTPDMTRGRHCGELQVRSAFISSLSGTPCRGGFRRRDGDE